MSRTTYSEKLKDPRWQKKRLEVMQRDGFACICCGDEKETLNVHHSYYVAGRDIWDYPASALLTLCHKCHKGHSEDPAGFIKKSGLHLGWWESETECATRVMLKVPAREWANFSIYHRIVTSDLVECGDVDPVEACRVICHAISYLMSKEWLEKVNAEAEAERELRFAKWKASLE